jgi:phage tail-like protein
MTSAGPFLPHLPKPPHDPTSLLLNRQVGWQAARFKDVEVRPDGSLALSLLASSRRAFGEPGGSFGGLTLPTNTALGPDGSLFLLDMTDLVLKVFDPCECAFVQVPCFGGAGVEARQLADPHGIGICAGNLFVCDTGNHRLGVFALRGYVLRGHWVPPAAAGLTNAWEPYDVAFDGRGRVYVSDSANGCIHCFTRSGRWEKCFSGFGAATHLAMDCRDHLYVRVAGPPDEVRLLGEIGIPETVAAAPQDLVGEFPPLPFEIDAKGWLHLGDLCDQPGDAHCGVFDLDGDRVDDPGTVLPDYQTDGFYISTALDSQLYRCQWHRLILQGAIPSNCRVKVSTYSAEALLTESELFNLPEAQWGTRQRAVSMDDGQWDCLVRSGPGRYLWLKLELRGNGRATPELSAVTIEFPRISLRRYLPAVFGAEAVSADFTDRFLSLFDTTLRGIEGEIDHLGRYFDPLSAPAEPLVKGGLDFLSWLSTWIGISLDRRWPEVRRRQFLKQAGRMFNLRGTRRGLWQQLVFYLGMEEKSCCCPDDRPRLVCDAPKANCAPVEAQPCAWAPPPLILEHYRIRRWLFLGAGRISDQAVLWGKSIVNRSQLDENAQVDRTQLIMTQDPYRDPFHVYAHKFTVFVPACFGRSDQDRKSLETLLKSESPAHTRYVVNYVEPRFRVGIQATLGFDAVVARVPEGVTLSQAALGKDAVLGPSPERSGGPGFELGDSTRLGTTTLID